MYNFKTRFAGTPQARMPPKIAPVDVPVIRSKISLTGSPVFPQFSRTRLQGQSLDAAAIQFKDFDHMKVPLYPFSKPILKKQKA